MKFLLRSLRIVAKTIVGAIICIVAIEFVVEMFYPAGIQTSSVRRAQELLFGNSESHELPDKVKIRIDGTDKLFYKDTQSYNKLLHLLQNGRSVSLFKQAGPSPQFPGTSHPFGEMVISSYGLPSHFKIIHSDKNENFYWIGLPKLTSPGTSYPIFTVDPSVIAFIRSQ